MAALDVSIIVVSYNTRDETLDCLRSVYEQTEGIGFEVIVVDNASSDGSPEAIASEFPQLELVGLDENIGFGRANNVGAKSASGRYILLLNPDTIVLDEAIQKLLAFAEADGRGGIYGGRTVFRDGSLNPISCRRRETVWSMFCTATGLARLFRNSPFFNADFYGSFKQDRIKEVDVIPGSFFLIGSDLWHELEGFDPVYFMYGEEVDLCYRARKRGHHCLFTPSSTIIHYGGVSEKIFVDKMVKLLSAIATRLRTHWPPMRTPIGLALLRLWILRRWLAWRVLGIFKNDSRQKAAEMWKVWQRRGDWLKGFRAGETNNSGSKPASMVAEKLTSL